MYLPHLIKSIQPFGKHTIGFFALLLLGLSGRAQAQFEPGYTVSYRGDTLNCWIKNEGWRNSPVSVSIRRTENGPEEQVNCHQIQAFGIGEEVFYRAESLFVDVSATSLQSLSFQREPEWKPDTLFIQQLVDGPANLFVYRKKGVNKYFFKVDTDTLAQLVYKKYQTVDGTFLENRAFALQLGSRLKCGESQLVDIERIEYTEKPILAAFEAYNACVGGQVILRPSGGQNKFHIQVLAGLDVHRYRVLSAYRSSGNLALKNQPSFRLGMEGEMVFAFKRSQWAATGEVGFHYFRNQEGIPAIPPAQFFGDITVRYHALETLMGIRRYFDLPGETRLFVSAFGLLDWNFKSSIAIGAASDKAMLNGSYTWGAGLGIRRGKWGGEIRIYDYRVLFENVPIFWDQRLYKASAVFSYRLK